MIITSCSGSLPCVYINLHMYLWLATGRTSSCFLFQVREEGKHAHKLEACVRASTAKKQVDAWLVGLLKELLHDDWLRRSNDPMLVG